MDLATIASAKIAPLMRDVLKKESYKCKIDNNKFGFLRTKEIYKKCMTEAYDKFGWTKQTF